jgi:hypothetical protein
MTPHRRVGALLSSFVMAVFPCMLPPPAAAESGSFTDPDDVNLPLDLKTIFHDNDGSTVTYTVETYEPFNDADADFRWGIDKTGDQKEDNFVSVEYDGQLVGKLEDAEENELGSATVTRPGPNSLRVSFPRKFLEKAAAYSYSLRALTDRNGNGEADPGEFDMAPDTGFYQHRL